MVNGVIIAQDAQRAERRTGDELRQVFAVELKFLFCAQQDNHGEYQCNKIAEKAFLHRRQIAGQPDEQIHQREEKRRQDNKENAFGFVICHSASFPSVIVCVHEKRRMCIRLFVCYSVSYSLVIVDNKC